MEFCIVCECPAKQKCAGCYNVTYCGREHQKIHWKRGHKNLCKCYELAVDDTLGRYLKATRDIKKGEIIIRENPLVVGPKIISNPICLGCHKLLQLNQTKNDYQRCTKCTWPICSTACETSAYHKAECELMTKQKYKFLLQNDATNNKQSSYCAITPLRCILMKQNNPDGYKRFNQLESHLTERQNTPLYNIFKLNLLPFFKVILGMTDLTDETILNVAAILDTNCFEIRLPSSDAKVRAIYDKSSMMAHDCRPNTRHIYTEKMQIVVLATVDIRKGDSITTSYTQPLKGTIERRLHLLNVKCFNCLCERCMDVTEFGTYIGAIICTKCKKDKIISTDSNNNNAPWQCPSCNHQLSAKQIDCGNNDIQKEINLLDKRSPKQFENFLIKYEEILHPSNTHVLQVKYALTQLYGNIPSFRLNEMNDAALKRKISLCYELLDVADILEPGWSLFRGNLLLDLQSAIAVLTKREYLCSLITKEAAQDKLNNAMLMLQEAVHIFNEDPSAKVIIQEKIENLFNDIYID